MRARSWIRLGPVKKLSLAVATLTSTAAISTAQVPSRVTPRPLPAIARADADARAPSLPFDSFGARLLALEVARRDRDSNTVLSPASGGLALSLVLLGARGTTETALANMLGFGEIDHATIEARGRSLINALHGRSDVQLEIANAVWVDTSARLTPAFAADVAAWGATAETLPLSTSAAVTSINRWTASATHGRIERILDEPLPDTTRLFVANAVYFKGKWLDGFEKNATHPHDFTLSSGHRIQVPAMERTGSIAYRRESNYQMARLPYRGDRTALYVILPDSGLQAGTLEREFSAGGWPPSLGARDERRVHLVLPKLHVEQSIELDSLLRTLGAGIAQDCRRADFGNIAVLRDPGSHRLCIGKAVQKVYLDIDEEGTEAAAVTGLEMITITSAPPPPLPFIVNRPFLFVLRDEASGVDLFVGSIRSP